MSIDHIKMPDILPLVRYVANGEQTVFTFPFPVFASEDLAVYFNTARQYSGFDVTGAGQTEGGTVTFDAPPAAGILVRLERRLPLERLTDFLEGGDFSARALNNELDFLLAAIQQVGRDQSAMLRYSAGEEPARLTLPEKTVRAHRALGFDGDGHPVALSLEGAMAPPDYTANGDGAVTRTVIDKLREHVSVKDFGAVGDGLADDTLAMQAALAAADAVFVPAGRYLLSAALTLTGGQSLYGEGVSSVLQSVNMGVPVVTVTGARNRVADLALEGGGAGVSLVGAASNTLAGVTITDAVTGLVIDGGDDADLPCHANEATRIRIENPVLHGVHVVQSGAGPAPSGNSVDMLSIHADSDSVSGCGVYVEDAAGAHSFTACAVMLENEDSAACVRLGAGSHGTRFVNLVAVSADDVPHVRLDDGSDETVLINLSAHGDGPAIHDLSGGRYTALNAGEGVRNRLERTHVTDLSARLMRYESEQIGSTGTTTLDLSHSVHLVDASGGAATIVLPSAATAPGTEITIKKTDTTQNIVTISETGGLGPDGRNFYLGGPYDYATILSDGSQWHVTSSSRVAGNARFVTTTGIYQIDMAVDAYLVSASGGAVIARLPPANAAAAIGRTVTVKKMDSSINQVVVTEQGGLGPDGSSWTLATRFYAVTVMSDGTSWHIVSKFVG